MSRESPDGRWLYFTRPIESGLWRMPATGGDEELVLSRFPHRTAGSWEFSGEEILFAVRQRGAVHLVAFHPQTGEGTSLIELPSGAAFHMTVSPDRGSLLFTQIDRRMSDIFQVRLPATGRGTS